MKIAYIDAKVNNPPEDYSVNPKRYGGGGVVARYAKQILNRLDDSFTIFASRDCFENLTDEDNKVGCVPVSEDNLAKLRHGHALKEIIPNYFEYDLFLHHHDCFTFNMTGIKAPLVHWALMGDGGANHPATPYSLLYRHDQVANHGKTFYVSLGKPIPAFNRIVKEDYIFQCSRHDRFLNTNEVAANCIKYGIKGYFAGPILNNYNLMDFIDNKNTFYLGSVSDKEKLNLTKKARLYTLLIRDWTPPFNQSAIEAFSYGTPILCNNIGFLGEIVQDNVNGFFFNNNFLECYEKATIINQYECYNTAKQFNHFHMVSSFYMAFEKILQDWYAY